MSAHDLSSGYSDSCSLGKGTGHWRPGVCSTRGCREPPSSRDTVMSHHSEKMPGPGREGLCQGEEVGALRQPPHVARSVSPGAAAWGLRHRLHNEWSYPWGQGLRKYQGTSQTGVRLWQVTDARGPGGPVMLCRTAVELHCDSDPRPVALTGPSYHDRFSWALKIALLWCEEMSQMFL